MFKEIENFKGYLIDTNGNVYSLKSNKILKHNRACKGYHCVVLMKDGIKHTCYVHRLVAETFVPNPKNLPTVNHKDGNKNNNTLENLEWMTYSENNQHSYDNKLKDCGEKFYNAKLTETDVQFIRSNAKKYNYNEFSKMFDVSRATIRDVITNKSWKHVA